MTHRDLSDDELLARLRQRSSLTTDHARRLVRDRDDPQTAALLDIVFDEGEDW